MKILAKFHFDGQTESADVFYWAGDLTAAKKDLAIVQYDGKYFEWVMYNAGTNGYDFEAFYSYTPQILPHNQAFLCVPKAAPPALECECGMEKHGFANHSRWCKKWKAN